MQKGEATRERIKKASLGLFHKKGYGSTSINHVLDSSGIKKGTFYFHYPSKEKLAVDVLDKALAKYEIQINEPIGHLPPSDQIMAVVEAIVGYHIEDGTSKGCLFGNMALEMGKNGTQVAAFVEKVFDDWVIRFEKLLKKAVENNEVILKESPLAFSRTIIALIQGGLVLSKISGNPDALIDCKKSIMALMHDRKIKQS